MNTNDAPTTESDYLTDDEKQSIIDAVYGNPGDRGLGTQLAVERIIAARLTIIAEHIYGNAAHAHCTLRQIVTPPAGRGSSDG